MRNKLNRLNFADSVRTSLSPKLVRDVESANFLLSSRWPVGHILTKDGTEPALLKHARDACGRAAVKRTDEAIEFARQSFIEAARSAEVLVSSPPPRRAAPARRLRHSNGVEPRISVSPL
jgi:hypothetical protein